LDSSHNRETGALPGLLVMSHHCGAVRVFDPDPIQPRDGPSRQRALSRDAELAGAAKDRSAVAA
jgi:hypothetical protein